MLIFIYYNCVLGIDKWWIEIGMFFIFEYKYLVYGIFSYMMFMN